MSAAERAPYAITIFAASGDASGLLVVERDNWVGKAIVFSRNDIASIKARPEFEKPGVYLLRPAKGQKYYIGEGDLVGPRIDSHNAQKEFWQRGAFFTSSNDLLHKAIIKYLEHRLLAIAGAKGIELDNRRGEKQPTLSESQIAAAETFLSSMQEILPLVGFAQFGLDEVPEAELVLEEENVEQVSRGKVAKFYSALPRGRRFEMEYKNVRAKLEIVEGGVQVCRGSQAMFKASPSFEKDAATYSSKRNQLISEGFLAERDNTYCFERDEFFTSGSAAASVVRGANSNADQWISPEGLWESLFVSKRIQVLESQHQLQ